MLSGCFVEESTCVQVKFILNGRALCRCDEQLFAFFTAYHRRDTLESILAGETDTNRGTNKDNNSGGGGDKGAACGVQVGAHLGPCG